MLTSLFFGLLFGSAAHVYYNYTVRDLVPEGSIAAYALRGKETEAIDEFDYEREIQEITQGVEDVEFDFGDLKKMDVEEQEALGLDDDESEEKSKEKTPIRIVN